MKKWSLEEKCEFEININMRCIEIKIYEIAHAPTKEININMRCIEIKGSCDISPIFILININMRCIEMY